MNETRQFKCRVQIDDLFNFGEVSETVQDKNIAAMEDY